MALLRLSFLLIALVGILQVLGAPNPIQRAPKTKPGSAMTKTDIGKSGYFYSHWVDDSATYTDAEIEKAVYEAGVLGMQTMETQAAKDKKGVPAVVSPAYIPKKGWLVASSIKGTPRNTQSPQTCAIVQDGNHLRYANCAEINAMALAQTKGSDYLTDPNVRIAAYSNQKTFYSGANKGKTGSGYFDPCNEGIYPDDGLLYDGCKQSLAKYSNWKALPATTAYDKL